MCDEQRSAETLDDASGYVGEADAHEGYREMIPLEDAQEILRPGNPDSIYTETTPELIASLAQNE